MTYLFEGKGIAMINRNSRRSNVDVSCAPNGLGLSRERRAAEANKKLKPTAPLVGCRPLLAGPHAIRAS
jgi:hypothetical protein